MLLHFLIKNKIKNNLLISKRGYSLIGKTMNLHFIHLGSSPDISIAWEAQLVERNTEDV
jgi:hypothetical protein